MQLVNAKRISRTAHDAAPGLIVQHHRGAHASHPVDDVAILWLASTREHRRRGRGVSAANSISSPSIRRSRSLLQPRGC